MAIVRAQRGFTLIEMVVVAAILAVLAGVAAISLAQRPGALAGAVGGFDTSLAAAKAIAASSGNGATLVFAPRTPASLPSFVLTVYRGRPTEADAVTPTTVMPVVSDASVSETSLGTPPFSIFLSSAGHASGLRDYPSLDDKGVPTFAVLDSRPPCPAGGFVLTFSDVHASKTRTLTCRVDAVSTPLPVAEMTPAPIVLTPPTLLFTWPGGPQAQFVATEWGYTRWFSAGGWTCSDDVAVFPTTPAPPYSQPYSAVDADALPLAPVTLPYSFANSSESMEDAPARMYLTPQAPGLCAVAIADANAQAASPPVQVMGPLTANPAILAWTDPTKSPAQSVTFGKTYDSQVLNATIVGNTCSGIVTTQWGARMGGPPTPPSQTPSLSLPLIVTPVIDAKGFDVGGAEASLMWPVGLDSRSGRIPEWGRVMQQYLELQLLRPSSQAETPVSYLPKALSRDRWDHPVLIRDPETPFWSTVKFPVTMAQQGPFAMYLRRRKRLAT